MIKLSKRLKMLADMVSENAVLADIGTDHGYIPIYLLQTGKIRRAYAMDIGEGPLLRAKEHSKAFGLEDYITLRLSDGVLALRPGEADSVLAAGMGGGVILHILEEGEAVIASARELILQPQSEIRRVREYLYKKGYVIDRENMVFEDGKYYPMMHIDMRAKRKKPAYSEAEWQMIYRYGELLLQDGNAVLRQYLSAMEKQYAFILEKLDRQQKTEAVLVRRKEIAAELSYVRAALDDRKGGETT